MKKPSARQIELLRLIGDDGADCWGELWLAWPGAFIDGPAALEFHNFNQVVEAVLRRGLVAEGDDGCGIALTAAGKNYIDNAQGDMSADTKLPQGYRRLMAGLDRRVSYG